MPPTDLLHELLPTTWSRRVAVATLAATPFAWGVPHWASPLWPSSTQAVIVLLQLSLSLLTLLVGSIATLVLVLIHLRKVTDESSINTIALKDTNARMTEIQAELTSIKAQHAQPEQEHTQQHLTAEQEKVLLAVCNQEEATAVHLSRIVQMGQHVVLHHLEEMRNLKLVRQYWRDETWQLLEGGRAYLVKRKLVA